jgi:diguanylate cyclase (GGDEF)-like protein
MRCNGRVQTQRRDAAAVHPVPVPVMKDAAMNGKWADTAKAVIWRYAAGGAVFGLFFPCAAMALLIASGAVGAPTSLAGLLAATHAHAPLLYVIDTAPIFLGLFAGFAGVRQSKLVVLNASLEQQVADQTASLRDALQRAEKSNVMISHMADHDPLTGLFNRRRMLKELAAAVSDTRRYGDPFALVFIDLNRFKRVNDSHGHDAGDRFLSGFAALLEQTARDTDRPGRWGGDEFVVLLPRSTRIGARQFADRLQERLGSQRIDIGPVQLLASASIGIAVHPDDGADPEALIAHADQEMYRVKQAREPASRVADPA